MDTQTTGGVDMGKLRDSIESILNAIVQSTELAKQVEAMTRDVGQLRQDIDTTQARNVELDRMLHDTREQRDRAEAELKASQADLSQAQRERDQALSQSVKLNQEADYLREQLTARTKERDEYGLSGIATQDALDKANAKLADIHKTMGIDFKPFGVEAKPEPPKEEVVAKTTEPEVPKRKVYWGEDGFDLGRPDDGWDGRSYQLI